MGLIKDSGAYLASGIQIGGFQIRFYALCILTGILGAYFLAMHEAKKFGVNRDKLFNGIIFGVVLGILGARVYYVIFEIGYYIKNPVEIFAIWNGGLAIHGGIIVGFLFAFLYCRKTKLNFIMVADFLAVGLLIGQICGRWGNFFNQEAHGGATTLEFLKSLHLPNFIIKQMCIDGVYYHPTFLYESLWNFILLVVILILRKFKTIRLGDSAGIYMIWYGIGRFFIEGMRTDSLMIGNLKQNQLISIVLIILGIAFLVFKYVKLDYDYYVNYPITRALEDKEEVKEKKKGFVLKLGKKEYDDDTIEEIPEEEIIEELNRLNNNEETENIENNNEEAIAEEKEE